MPAPKNSLSNVCFPADVEERVFSTITAARTFVYWWPLAFGARPIGFGYKRGPYGSWKVTVRDDR
jgi:hypothetical protein